MVGRATARHLIAAGWQVDVTSRGRLPLPADLRDAGVRLQVADRSDAVALGAALGDGADLLVDCVCFAAADARLLLPLAANAASTVLVSSKAVYVDEHGNHSNSATPPDYGGPIRETQRTLPPDSTHPYDSAEGYGPNKVAAEHVALDSGLPISVLRPSRIHGPGAERPREWVFVKRVLDRRPVVLLAARGSGVVHTTAAANIAALIETVAHKPGARVLNSADPDAPSALEIARTVARHLGHTWREVLLDERAPAGLGRTPWDSPHPVVLDTSAAVELGYQPVGDFATTVAASIDELAKLQPTLDDDYLRPLFDYAAEDAYLGREHGRYSGLVVG